MYVAKRCRELVFEGQKTSLPQAALMISAQDLWDHDALTLSATTGVPLSFKEAPEVGGKGGEVPGLARADIKWCSACPHRNGLQCFCDPSWRGEMPCSVYLSKERLEAIKRARTANALQHGVTCSEFRAPSQSPTNVKSPNVKPRRRKAKGEREKWTQRLPTQLPFRGSWTAALI